MDTSDSCPQALGDPSPAGQQTHLVHPWALAIRHAHPSLGPQAGPASRRSHSSLCQLGPQAAVPARAVAGLVQGGARSWTPCPFGKELDGERAELSPSPWHALLTLSLPRGRPSQPSGADLPSPAPRPLGLHNGWGMGTSSSSSGPGLAEMGTLLPLTNQAVPGATFQEVAAGKSCHLPSPAQVGGFWSGHRDVLRSASPLQGRRTPCQCGHSKKGLGRLCCPLPSSPQYHIPFPIIFPDSILSLGC